jgi:osmotically-inducible protein OsmY
MPRYHSNDEGPLYSHGWDEREDQYRRQHYGYESGWGPTQTNFTRDDNPNRGGFTGRPGSNYAAGSFSGAGQGLGFRENQYRGYLGGEGRERDFANRYRQSQARDEYYPASGQRSQGFDSKAGYNRPHGQRDTYPLATRRWQDDDWATRAGYGPSTGSDRRREAEDGPHRGKGPKNYHRSDGRIREDVSDRLSDDPYVDASDINIVVTEGNVILSGRVQSRQAKRRAADLAELVRGVTNVENRLRTGQGVLENVSHAVTAAIGDVTLGPDPSRVETQRRGRKKKGSEGP